MVMFNAMVTAGVTLQKNMVDDNLVWWGALIGDDSVWAKEKSFAVEKQIYRLVFAVA